MNSVGWRPTAAHARAVAGAATFVLAAVLARRPDLVVLAAPLAVAAVGATVRRPSTVPDVEQSIDRTTVREGERASWRIDVNDSDGLVDDVGHVFRCPRWVDAAPGTSSAVCSLRDDGSPLIVPLRATHWGSHLLRPATVIAASAWGGFRWTAPAEGSVRVLTLPGEFRFDAAAAPVRMPGLIGANRSPRLGSGSEFADIRPFTPGDRLRRIHWVESLRSGTLHVTSTWSDDDRHVVLLVDAFDEVGPSDGVDGRSSSLDVSVRAAAAVAEHYCTSGDRVTVVTMGATGVRRIPPSSGHRHLRRLLDVLSRVEPSHVSVDKGRIPRGLGRSSLVVLFSPLISEASLRRIGRLADRGMTVAAIDCLPADIADEDPRDPYPSFAWRIEVLRREQRLRRLREAGIAVVPWAGPGSLDLVLRGLQRRGPNRVAAR